MKLADNFPRASAFKTLLCSVSNNGRLQKLIFNYLIDLHRVLMQILSTQLARNAPISQQQPMQNNSCDKSEDDTVLFSLYAVLRESDYSGSVVIDAADTDAYVAAAVISQQLPGLLC